MDNKKYIIKWLPYYKAFYSVDLWPVQWLHQVFARYLNNQVNSENVLSEPLNISKGVLQGLTLGNLVLHVHKWWGQRYWCLQDTHLCWWCHHLFISPFKLCCQDKFVIVSSLDGLLQTEVTLESPSTIARVSACGPIVPMSALFWPCTRDDLEQLYITMHIWIKKQEKNYRRRADSPCTTNISIVLDLTTRIPAPNHNINIAGLFFFKTELIKHIISCPLWV